MFRLAFVYCMYVASYYAMGDRMILLLGTIALVAGTAYGLALASARSQSPSITPGDAPTYAFRLSPKAA